MITPQLNMNTQPEPAKPKKHNPLTLIAQTLTVITLIALAVLILTLIIAGTAALWRTII